MIDLNFPTHLFVGQRDYWLNFIKDTLQQELNLNNLNNCPDIYFLELESLGVKNAHEIINKENRGPLALANIYFVIICKNITPEASNALLKTLEEPSLNANFFFIIPSEKNIPTTLLSRFRVYKQAEFTYSSEEEQRVKEFLSLDYPEKLEFVRKFFLKDKEKDRLGADNFLAMLIKIASLWPREDKLKYSFFVRELIRSREYLNNPRSSLRLILEHVCLTSPIILGK